ncbi:uncharacterized protein map7d3 isoform X4 [Vanacampus margaritifer]
MAEATVSLKDLRSQMAAAAQAQAEERRSLAVSPAPPANAAAKAQGCRPVLDGGTLRVDDRLRVAKERREEADRQQALRESQIMERERKAKMQVERQQEERHKKATEQRRKEEQKRLAVEEKRKQKQEEEKEHYEAVMRRTLERSQRADQRQKRWSWGGLSTDSDGRTGDSDAGASSPVTIVVSTSSPEKPPRNRQDKRSTSTANLKQPAEASISKRLSSSSATLVKSPDKSLKSRSSSCNRLPRKDSAAKEEGKKLQADPTARKQATCTVDGGGVISRLLTPTQASLARSKSAAALSPEGTDAAECHLCPRSASATPLHPPRGPLRSRSIDRQKNGMTTSVSADGALDPSLNKQEKTFTSSGRQRPPSPSIPMGRTRSPSPAPKPSPKRTPSPAASKQNSKARPPSPATKHPSSPQPTSAKPPPIQKPALTPPGPPTLRKRDSRSKDMLLPLQPGVPQATDSSKSKEKDDSKTGTNSAAEAAKLLAEHRRQMREQKEKDEQLRIQREEEEKLRKEEEQCLAEEARLKRQEEEKQLAEERKLKEEEEAQRAEEERERLEAEEAVKQAELQKEREEAEAKALEEAERVRQERERIMQQNQQERMERKKRIEEIMKRTRKGDGNDFKRDDDKDQEDNEDGMDMMSFDAKSEEGPMGDVAMEMHNCGDGVPQREEPLGCLNGRGETDDKENNNAPDDTQAVSPVSKSRLLEGSEFQNEQDSAKVDLVSGLGGKSNPWSFEDLMDRNSKTHALIEAEDCNPVLINCDGSDGTKGSPVNSLHSSSQAMEALSEI